MIKFENKTISSAYSGEKIIEKIYKGTLKVYEGWKTLIASGVPPLKIYSKGINKGYKLPSEYQEVEYIESTGAQYINTDYTDVSDTRIELDFVYTGRLGTSSYMGSNGGNVMAINASGILSINASSTGIKPTAGERYKITSYRGVDDIRSATLNGVEYIGTKASRNETYYIFTLGGQYTSEQRIYGKLYSCKIYYQDKIVRDFIPCYRKSDNVIGAYDLVNGVFYTNAGTGTFLKGRNVSTGLDLIDYKIYGNSVQSKVPNEYQQVDYIEGTGTQYIELDYIASNITNSKGTYQITNMISALMLFGSRKDGNSNGYALNWGASTTPATYFNTYYSGGTAGLTKTQLSAEISTFEKRGVDLYINDELVHTHAEVPTFTTPYKMIVFGCNSGGNISYFAKAKIFNLQFYDNDELKVDLIPCYRKSDNEIGMYDTVTGTFYINKGTGTFLKGNDITPIPTPEEPIEIESVGDKTKNLLNLYDVSSYPITKNGITVNVDKTTGRIYISGKATASVTISMLPKLLLDSSKKYTVSLSSNKASSGFYSCFANDENSNAIFDFGMNSTNIKTRTITGISKLYSFGFWINANTVFEEGHYVEAQLEEGTTPTEYEPYGYKIPVKVSKENLLKLKDGIFANTTLEYTSKNQIITKKCISTVRTSFLLQTGPFDKFIGTSKLKAGTYIWNLYNVTGTPKITNPYIVLTTSNGTINWKANTSITLTEEATITQVRNDELSYSTGSTQQFEIQIQEGDSFIEPITTNIYLKEPLRKFGDYVDYVDFKNKKIVRRIGNDFITFVNSKSGLAGSYTIFLTPINNETYIEISGNTVNYTKGFAVSNKFLQNKKVYYDLLSNGGYIQTYKTSGGIDCLAYSFNDTSITTIEQATEKIGDGFDVNYVLETPKEETIELPNIPTFKGTTIIEVDTKVQPSNMEVVYKGKEVK